MNAAGRRWARTILRRRRRAIALLAVLVAVAGGGALTALIGANRSGAVVEETMTEHRQPDVMSLPSEPDFDWGPIVKLPEIEAYGVFAATPMCMKEAGGLGPDSEGICTQPPLRGGWYDTIWTVDILDGRMPTGANEIAINRLAQSTKGWQVGDHLHVEAASPARLNDYWSGKKQGSRPWGPTFDVTVTAVFRGEDGWRVLSGGVGAPGFIMSTSFMPTYGDSIGYIPQAFLRMHGDDAQIRRLRSDIARITGNPAFPIRNVREGQRRVERGTSVEAAALRLFAAAVIAAAAVLLGQALLRLIAGAAGEARTLRSLGMSPRTRVAAMAAPGAVVAVAGAAGAVAIAIAASDRMPIGIARSFDLHPGTKVDLAVLVPGALAIAAGVVLASVLAALSAVRAPRRARSARPGRAVLAIARLPLAPPAALGVRMALERGPRGGAVAIRPGLIGAAVGVLAVVAAFTVRDGMSDALSHPQRAGKAWDTAYYVDGKLPERAIAKDRDIAGVARVRRGSVDLDGLSVKVHGIAPLAGARPLQMAVLDGRRPLREGEIALGPSTAAALHVGVGDALRGPAGSRPLLVVGTALLWEEGGHAAYDEGGWMTDAGFARLKAPEIDWNYYFIDVREGADVAAVDRRLAAAGGASFTNWPEPAGVRNLRTVRDLPALLAALLALLGAGGVGHALVSSVRRRQRDLAVLRALGLSRRGAWAVLAWQATTVALVGLVVGIPLGILGGHLIWRWMAGSMPLEYVAPSAILAAALVVPAVLVLVNAVAVWPGRAAARMAPAAALRTE